MVCQHIRVGVNLVDQITCMIGQTVGDIPPPLSHDKVCKATLIHA